MFQSSLFKWAKRWSGVIRLFVSSALLLWLCFSFDWRAAAVILARADLLWLVLACLTIIVSMGISTVKWDCLLKELNIRESFFSVWQLYWIGLFFNNFLPSSIGGDAVRVVYLGKQSGKTKDVVFSVLAERLIALAALAAVGFTAGWFTPIPFWISRGVLPSLFAVSVLGYFAAAYLPKVKRPCSLMTLCAVFALSVAFQISVVLVNVCIFRALGVSVGFWAASAVIPAAMAVAMVPAGINGYGLREGAYIFLFGMFGVSKEEAFAASLLFALLVALCSLYGGVFWVLKRGTFNEGASEIQTDAAPTDGEDGLNAVKEYNI